MTLRAAAAAAAVLALLGGCAGEQDPGLMPTDEKSSRHGGAPADPDPERTAKVPEVAPEPLPSAPPLTASWQLPRSPQELTRRLTLAEDLLHDPGTAPRTLDAAAFETQLLYRHLARTPAWEAKVRAALPGRYRASLADHLTARRSLRSVLTELSNAVPAWRIVAPEPTQELERFYRDGEEEFGVPWEVLAAVNFVETGFGKIRGTSTAGAQGPMQFMPETWSAYGEGDIDDPRDAILGAARYLAANGGGTGDPADLENALYRYNNHSGYVQGILAYARIIERDPAALDALVRWQIMYLSEIGDLWLPIGYESTSEVPVRRYAEEHPERHLGTITN